MIVDSTQGVEAQTLANVYQALDTNHEIVPVLNKVDLPASDLDRTKKQIEEVIGIDTENAIPCSGKTGEGIEDILEQIITTLPAPKGESSADLKCLLVDSWYDTYLGVVILVRVIDGKLSKHMKIKMVGKASATIGNSIVRVTGKSGRKYVFQKRPGEGYVYNAENNDEVYDIFESQHNMGIYRYTPILDKSETKQFETEGLDLQGLRALCDTLGIETIPQDKERSLKRLLTAYNLGAKS